MLAAWSSEKVHITFPPSGFLACTELRVSYWSPKVKPILAVSRTRADCAPTEPKLPPALQTLQAQLLNHTNEASRYLDELV